MILTKLEIMEMLSRQNEMPLSNNALEYLCRTMSDETMMEKMHKACGVKFEKVGSRFMLKY